MTKHKMSLMTVTAVVLLGIGACGSGTDTSDTGDAAEDARTQAPESSETITIQDFKFRPDTLEVPAGTTVVWTNQDGFLHTVTSGDFSGATNKPDGMFDESLPEQGATAEVTFDEPGTFTYFCRQHNVMNAQIAVTTS